ncbi:MAG: GntR family transcriptional regulator [Pseudomonadota bacterium]
MGQDLSTLDRRTSADDVFDWLHEQINSLKLLPGTRISEIEVARRFDLSRQPVREAFIRLANRELVLIRPQKATIVRRFSYEKIVRARFVRLSIECEVLRRACNSISEQSSDRLSKSLEKQSKAIDQGDIDRFHNLDYEFHRQLCAAANSEFVFETIAEYKAQVDRLCMLSLSQPATMQELLTDHEELVDAVKRQDTDKVTKVIHAHLCRLDDVIAGIRKSHADYFED